MPRYRLEIEYDGTDYCGWQRQENGLAVQQVVEEAGRALSGAEAPVYAAGRTDSGVHGIAMTAHIDLVRSYTEDTVMSALNAHMRPHPIAVLRARAVADDFHARFSCCRRSYLYRIIDRRAPPALLAQRVWHVPQALDADAMGQAAQHLIGKHDFTTFRASQCQADSPVKTLDVCAVVRTKEELHLEVAAPSFLHHQVRSIAGSLVQVGLGRWTPDDLAAALRAADRSACGTVAPSKGLYFVSATYPDDLTVSSSAKEGG